MDPVTFTIAVFVTLTVATTVVTYMHEVKIRNAREKDSIVKKAQIIIDEDGNQTVHLYDEHGMELGSENYNKFIIKGIKREAEILQKEVIKSHKETEILQKELFKTREELQRSKDENSKFKAQYEDVAKSLKSASSAESSGGTSFEESQKILLSCGSSRKLSFSETSIKDVQKWLSKKDSKEELTQKTYKLKVSPNHSSHSGANSREDSSGDEFILSSSIRHRHSITMKKAISNIPELNENDPENPNGEIPNDTIVSSPSSMIANVSRSSSFSSSSKTDAEDTLKFTKSHPVPYRREIKKNLDKSPEKSASVKSKILKFKTGGNSDNHDNKKFLDKGPYERTEEVKAKISKLKTSFTSDYHKHKKVHDKNPNEKSEVIQAEILKFKSNSAPEFHPLEHRKVLERTPIKLNDEEPVINKFKSSTSSKMVGRESARNLENPIKISLVKCDSENIVSSDNSLNILNGQTNSTNEKKVTLEYSKSSGSRSNIFVQEENNHFNVDSKPLNSSGQFSLAMQDRVTFIETLIVENSINTTMIEENSTLIGLSSETYK